MPLGEDLHLLLEEDLHLEEVLLLRLAKDLQLEEVLHQVKINRVNPQKEISPQVNTPIKIKKAMRVDKTPQDIETN